MAVKASVCSILNKFFDVMPEILIGVAIDVVTRREQSFLAVLGITTPESQIIFLSILTLVIWISESTFEYLFGILWQNLAQLVQHNLRVDVFRHVQKLDLEWFDGIHSGEITSILNDDINQLERFLNVGANSLLQVASAVVFIGAVFFYLAWDIALVAILPIPVILWGAAKYRRLAEPRYKQVREAAGVISAQLSGGLAGIGTMKAFAAEKFELDRLTKISRDYVAANSGAIKVNSAFTPVIRMAVLSGFVGTLVLAGLRAISRPLTIRFCSHCVSIYDLASRIYASLACNQRASTPIST
jgi:ATP-binding cassette subfamily B protein